ncbi:MAG: hypothetical protein ACM3NS_08555 [Deltaproteobacteria bacterium]
MGRLGAAARATGEGLRRMLNVIARLIAFVALANFVSAAIAGMLL